MQGLLATVLRRGGLLLAAAWLLGSPLPAAAQADVPAVRVRLMELHEPQAVTVHSTDGMLAMLGHLDAPPLAQLEPGDLVQIRLRNGELSVSTPVGQLYALTLNLVPETTFTLDVTEGRTPPEPRHYAGYLTITPTSDGSTLQLINHVPLEDYVASVVGREYGFDDREGAKAMAVLIRTYALHSAGKFGERYDHVDHSASQVYEGLGRQTEASRIAARETQGEVLTYNGQFIEAVYSASSGGHTADNDAVWDAAPLPYLRGKRDPYDYGSPYTSWESTIERDRLLELISATYGFESDGFLIADRSRDGRVSTIELLRDGDPYRTISANEFRLLVNRSFGKHALRSTLFKAKRQGNTYILEGSGFGHGVGLSQYGALELSKLGRSYREILSYYFTGVSLASMSNMEPVLPTEVIPVEQVIRPASHGETVPQETATPPEKEPTPSTKRRVGW